LDRWGLVDVRYAPIATQLRIRGGHPIRAVVRSDLRWIACDGAGAASPVRALLGDNITLLAAPDLHDVCRPIVLREAHMPLPPPPPPPPPACLDISVSLSGASPG